MLDHIGIPGLILILIYLIYLAPIVGAIWLVIYLNSRKQKRP